MSLKLKMNVLITNSNNEYQMNEENKENKNYTPRHEEYQYLDQIRHVIKSGTTKGDRTGVGTRSVFGSYARYTLRDSNKFNNK